VFSAKTRAGSPESSLRASVKCGHLRLTASFVQDSLSPTNPERVNMKLKVLVGSGDRIMSVTLPFIAVGPYGSGSEYQLDKAYLAVCYWRHGI